MLSINSRSDDPPSKSLSVVRRPAAAAVATYAGEKLIDKMVDEEAKPDFLDLDGDGDKEEPMKKAAKEKEMKRIGDCLFEVQGTPSVSTETILH